MDKAMPQLYKILNISKKSSKTKIKKAYFNLAKVYHPDVPTGDKLKFMKIKSAYNILCKDRNVYDTLPKHQQNIFDYKWSQQFIKQDAIVPYDNGYITKIKRFFFHQEQEHYNEEENYYEGTYKNFHFVLDNSFSMHSWSSLDESKMGIKKKYTRDKFIDGSRYCLHDVVTNGHKLPQIRYLGKCVTGARKILIKNKEIEHISLSLFNDYIKPIFINKSNTYASAYLNDNLSSILDEKEGNETNIYDAIYNVFDAMNWKKVDQTLVILLTDGSDTNSCLTVEDIIKHSKFKDRASIIIILLEKDINDINNFKKILAAARFGKLYCLGEDFNISEAINKFPEIVQQIMNQHKLDNKKIAGLLGDSTIIV